MTGTRTAPGKAGTYFPGVAALYNRIDVPMVPVALNSGLFWGRRAFLKQPGKILLEFLEPIAPGQPRKAFEPELKARIKAGSARLLAEGRGKPAADTSS